MTDDVSRRGTLRATGALALSGLVAGCSSGDGTDEPTTALPEFAITELVFCAEKPGGYDQYERQPDRTYSPGATVWVYADVVGFETEAADGGQVSTDIAESLTVRDPDGRTIHQDQFDLANEFRPEVRGRYFIVNDITLPEGIERGQYGVEIELTDQIAGATTTATGTFRVE